MGFSLREKFHDDKGSRKKSFFLMAWPLKGEGRGRGGSKKLEKKNITQKNVATKLEGGGGGC